MWDNNETISQSGRCFAETLIETECRSFVGTVDKFSSTEPNRKNLVCIQSSSMKNFFSSMKFCVAVDDKLEIEMKPLDYDHLYKYKCKIFIRDSFGNKVKSGQGEFHDTKSQCIPLTLPKEHLMENKGYYLPDDVLTIECEIIFPTGKTIEKLDEPEYGFELKDPREMISNVVKNFFCLKEHQTESLTALKDDCIENEVIFPTNKPIENIDEHEPENECVCNDTQSIIIDPKNTSIFSEENIAEKFSTLKDDWISLFNEGIACDTELKTTTETFRVHKAVLIARSPVFKSMFTTDMAEKASNCVEIDDLDDDTVRRMLKFMYSDTLDNLGYESAKNLYFSSDKYDIVSLRYRCSNFLKQNFLQSKCCEILLLADKHEDTDLKNVVKDYIAKNGEEILSPEEWENLEKNHSLLAIEVLRAINRVKTQET
ncbi:TD and POZ domain-containing protein 3 [Araneus ventricosus]|nr:TD and POZ domain-containing protein 3 [Araneus ventricosus]